MDRIRCAGTRRDKKARKVASNKELALKVITHSAGITEDRGNYLMKYKQASDRAFHTEGCLQWG